jgi:hypothetical protein
LYNQKNLIAKQVASQLVQIPWGHNISSFLPPFYVFCYNHQQLALFKIEAVIYRMGENHSPLSTRILLRSKFVDKQEK